jgi:hypothetical protein
VRLLFALSSPEYFRFFDETLFELVRRGHHVTVAVDIVRPNKPVSIDALSRGPERLDMAGVVPRRADGWEGLAGAVRGTQDFVRYLHPALSAASKLRARARSQALPWCLQPLDRLRELSPARVARLQRWLAAIERRIPVSAAVTRFLDSVAPDVVLVSPLVEHRSEQVDLVRAAQARGLGVATLVASWDNLTNKGDLRVRTELVTVWNEQQRREAIELHRAAPDAVVVTGAQVFDRWFDRRPSTTRDEFCRRVGLPDAGPFVLYTGSSIFVARAEAEMPFVRRWIEALRRSADPAVSSLAVLVRPHPYNGRAWRPETFADLPGVSVWPRGGFDPIDETQRTGLFDSLFHATAVVGLNTSAMIEAAIVGRPVLSIELPEFEGSQGGTLHYRHLLRENGGFLQVATTLEGHAAQLGGVLARPEQTRAELAAFVERFVRPRGLDRPALPVLVEAIEVFAARHARAPRTPAGPGGPVSRALLWCVARATPLFAPPSQRKPDAAARRLRKAAIW